MIGANVSFCVEGRLTTLIDMCRNMLCKGQGGQMRVKGDFCLTLREDFQLKEELSL